MSYTRIVSIALLMTAHVAWPLRAQAGVAAGIATEWTQYSNFLTLISQLTTLRDQLSTVRDQLQDMTTNSLGLNGSAWGSAMQQLQRLDQVVRTSGAIAYSAASLDQDFKSRYPGYDAYASQRLGAGGMRQKYQAWTQEVNGAVLTALRVAGLQAADFATEEQTMIRLRSMSDHSVGRMQAIQVGNQIAGQQVAQLQKLRQLVMTQMQMQGDYQAAQSDREAAQREAQRQRNREPNIPVDNGERF